MKRKFYLVLFYVFAWVQRTADRLRIWSLYKLHYVERWAKYKPHKKYMRVRERKQDEV